MAGAHNQAMAPDVGWDRGGSPSRARWLILGAMLMVVIAAGALLGRGIPGGDPALLRVEEGARGADGADAAARAAAGAVDVRLFDDLAPGDLVPGRWEAIASGPLSGRSLATMTWTGREAIIWGGLGAEPHGDGAAYDPAAGSWTLLPESPLSPRFGHAAAWTGRELVIAGGATTTVPGDTPVYDLSDAAAFSPFTQQWRTLPALPFPTGAGHLFAAHDRLFAIAADVRPVSIAVLEPGAMQWSGLDVPRPGGTRGEMVGAVEAGMVHNELVVWNRRGRGAGVAVDVTDPARWRRLGRAPHPLSDVTDCCVLVASEAGDGADAIVYDRTRDVWRPLAEDSSGSASLAVSRDLAFLVRLEGSSAALDLRTATPLRLPPAPVSRRRGAAATWAGDRLLVWGGADVEAGNPAPDGAAFVMPAR